MKIIAVVMAIAMVFFMFTPEVTIKNWEVSDISLKDTMPICALALAPEPCYWARPSEFIEPKPDPDDGD